MTDANPQPRLSADGQENNRPAAILAWVLYILALPSANVLAVVGVIIAYAARDKSTGWVREHFDRQIALFWKIVIWLILLWIAIVVFAVLSFAVVGIPFLLIALLALLVLHIYFGVVSVFGALKAVNRQAP